MSKLYVPAPMYQAIVTKFHGPTNVRGARYSARCEATSVIVSADDALDVPENHARACKLLCTKMADKGHKVWLGHWIGSALPDGRYTFVSAERPRQWPRVPSEIASIPERERRAAYLEWCYLNDRPDSLANRISAGVWLDIPERAALLQTFGHGCQAGTVVRLRRFAESAPDVPLWSLYERVTFVHRLNQAPPFAVGSQGSPAWERARTSVMCDYCAGQSYPDEIRRVRDLMVGR